MSQLASPEGAGRLLNKPREGPRRLHASRPTRHGPTRLTGGGREAPVTWLMPLMLTRGLTVLQSKKSKKSKKKKGKLEPGMAEAQTWGSAVIRMIR